MLGFEMTEQPPPRVFVDEIFTCAFHCPIKSRSFSKIEKTFTPNTSHATAKLVDLPTLEDIDDATYILGNLRAQFSENVADRILRFQIGIRKPGSYKLLLSIHAKTSDWNTPLHYPVISDLWTDEIYVEEPSLQPVAEEPSLQSVAEEPSSQPATEELPRLYPPGIPNIRLTESLVDQNGYEDECATDIPFAYYRILMQAPLSPYQRTYLIEAMTAVTANKNPDDHVEESEDSDDDDYEGGVPLSKKDMDDHGLTEAASDLSLNHCARSRYFDLGFLIDFIKAARLLALYHSFLPEGA